MTAATQNAEYGQRTTHVRQSNGRREAEQAILLGSEQPGNVALTPRKDGGLQQGGGVEGHATKLRLGEGNTVRVRAKKAFDVMHPSA